MGKASRNKGQRGEREVCKLLAEKLGGEFKRNLMQTAEGGHDVIGLTGCALEVKRQETLNVNAWWEQTVEQSKSNMLPKPQWPVLFYRKNHCPWSVVVLLAMINDEFNGDDSVTTVNLDTFIKIYEWRDEK